jgi:sensor domain CHASE-containing protein
LDTYTLSTIFSTPSLLQSLTQHTTISTQQQTNEEEKDPHQQQLSNHSLTAANGSSVLLLRVLAAADYFSHHSSLMKDPPPVLVDLILDPYLYNVLPQSLVPTVGYIVVISIISWFVARRVSGYLVSVATSGEDVQTKKRN